MRTRTLLFSLCLALAACGGSQTASGTGASTAGGEVPAGVTLRPPAVIHVRSNGSEPRIPVRYRFAEGQMEALTMRMRMAMQMANLGTTSPRIEIPEMTASMTFGPIHVREDGAYDCPFRFTGIEVADSAALPAEALTAMRDQLRSMEGIEGSQRIDARGQIAFVHISIPETASPSLRQTMEQMQRSLEQMAFAFPEEPLGAGAEFDVTMRTSGPPIAFTQIAHVRIASIDGDALRFTTEIEQTADPQPLVGPEGTEVELVAMRGTGQNAIDVNLTQLLPSGTFAVIVEVVARATAGANTATVTTHLDMEGDFVPRR